MNLASFIAIALIGKQGRVRKKLVRNKGELSINLIIDKPLSQLVYLMAGWKGVHLAYLCSHNNAIVCASLRLVTRLITIESLSGLNSGWHKGSN